MVFSVLRRSDFVIGLALIVFGGLATWLALQISQGPTQRTLSPNVVPLICTVGIMICGLVLAVRALIFGSDPIAKAFDVQQLFVAVLIGAFLLSFPYVDFRLAIAVFTLATMVALGCRSWAQLIIVPLATAGTIWLVFGSLFQVYLPKWI